METTRVGSDSSILRDDGIIENVKQEGKKAIKKVVDSFDVDGAEPNTPEGEVTKQIESVTAQIPSGAFLSVACGAIGASLFMQLAGRKEDAQFLGQWAPTILLLGLYNKIVKLHGSQ